MYLQKRQTSPPSQPRYFLGFRTLTPSLHKIHHHNYLVESIGNWISNANTPSLDARLLPSDSCQAKKFNSPTGRTQTGHRKLANDKSCFIFFQMAPQRSESASKADCDHTIEETCLPFSSIKILTLTTSCLLDRKALIQSFRQILPLHMLKWDEMRFCRS